MFRLCASTRNHKMVLPWSCALHCQLISPDRVVLHLKLSWPWIPLPSDGPNDSHRRTCAIAHSFLQKLLHHENGSSPVGKTLTSGIYFIALFEDPPWKRNGARQFSPEHMVTDVYDCSWNQPRWSVLLAFRARGFSWLSVNLFLWLKGNKRADLFLVYSLFWPRN